MPPGDSGDAAASDAKLMKRIGAGDVDAFQNVMRTNGPWLVRLAYGVVGRQDEAEDIAQESLLSLWQTAEDWKPKATIGAFLRTVATRKAIDVLRRRKRDVDEFPLDELLDPGADPEEELERHQDVEMVRRMLGTLPERQRAAIALSHFEGLSLQEAASSMNLDLEAYASLLARARRTLRRHIEQDTGDQRNGD